jgi:uncharacterized protein YuzE
MVVEWYSSRTKSAVARTQRRQTRRTHLPRTGLMPSAGEVAAAAGSSGSGAGYGERPPADLITAASKQDITMITPVLLDHSPQARAAEGFDKTAFTVDWKTRQVRCPAQQQGSPLTVADVRVTYDKTADAAYVYLTEPQARVKSARMYPCDPVDVDAMINLDFDEQDRLIGIRVGGQFKVAQVPAPVRGAAGHRRLMNRRTPP